MEFKDTPTIECHPPERRRRRTEIRLCCGSCCCCCCCLHTVGGIVGAVILPKMGTQSTTWSQLSLIAHWEDEEFESSSLVGAHGGGDAITENVPTSVPQRRVSAVAVPDIVKPSVSAVKVFWLMSLGASIIGAMIGAITEGNGNFIIGLVILALVFPAVQLVCAILTLIGMALSARPDKSFQMRQVGKIALGLFLGNVAGILVMFVIGMIMSKS